MDNSPYNMPGQQYNQPQQNQPSYNQPQQGQYGQPTYNQPQQGQYGQPSYNQPQQDQYGQSSYSQPQQNYGDQNYGSQSYDRPSYQQPYQKDFTGGQQKSKLVAGLLGIFLGAYGIHNFYLGYTKRALIQLLLTVLSCFTLSVVSGIWGLVEGIMILCGSICTDSTGNLLKD